MTLIERIFDDTIIIICVISVLFSFFFVTSVLKYTEF